MAECMNLHHRRNHIPGNQGITHAGGCLYNAVAYIAYCKDTGFAACFKDSVVHLGDERLEMKGSRVSHPPGTLDEDLRLGKVFFSPIHSQSERVALMIVCAEFLAAKLPLLAWHARSPAAPLRCSFFLQMHSFACPVAFYAQLLFF